MDKVFMQENKEKVAQLYELINEYRSKPGALILVLQQAQGIFGYLPEQVQSIIATELRVPLPEVYGVATFYSLFSLEPKGKYVIRLCDGTACHVRSSMPVLQAVREKLALPEGKKTTADMKFSVETVSCLGACGLAPVVMINDQVYGQQTPDSIKLILDKLMQEGGNE
ncbi:MAG: NAD(P)H-dependent oxidoreductase subunit E [Bacillota bacterium]